jgi:MSHA biogenesis protein MshJ
MSLKSGVPALVMSLGKRIDAANPRERLMMFASAAVALVAVVDALVLSPALTERRQLVEQATARARDIATLRAQLAGLDAGPEAPELRLRRHVEAARSELAALDQRIQAQLAARDEIARLPVVLDRLLAKHERLTLVRLSTVAPSSAATPAATAAATPSVTWQGVDLSVAGRYADLVRYLSELEGLMPGLRWGELRVVSPRARTSSAQALPSNTVPSPRDEALPVLSLRLTLPGDTP